VNVCAYVRACTAYVCACCVLVRRARRPAADRLAPGVTNLTARWRAVARHRGGTTAGSRDPFDFVSAQHPHGFSAATRGRPGWTGGRAAVGCGCCCCCSDAPAIAAGVLATVNVDFAFYSSSRPPSFYAVFILLLLRPPPPPRVMRNMFSGCLWQGRIQRGANGAIAPPFAVTNFSFWRNYFKGK